MSFDPLPKQILSVEETRFQIAEHPAAPGIAYGQEGRAAIVYKVEAGQRSHALKVFKTRFRVPTLAMLADQLAPYASIPGLSVCRRSVLTPQRHTALLREYPDLTYAVVMPWIEGPTWFQIVQDRQAIPPEQSLFLGQALARILGEMEQQGIAHCDLSASNLILPALAANGPQSSSAPIELVDVEQLYAANLKRPAAVPSGSEGYAHATVRQGAWEDKADRFSGAVLLAEILGWCDPQVREAAWGESYFAPQEMQRPCPRFDLLQRSLASQWGGGVAQLFANAWNSELLADCPTFGEWMVAIPEAPISHEPKPADQNPAVKALVTLAEQMIALDNLPGAAQTYRSALALLPQNSPEATTIAAQIQAVEKRLAEWAAAGRPADHRPVPPPARVEPDRAPENSRTCPFCKKPIPPAAAVCPYCERELAEPGARGPARPEDDRPPQENGKKPKKGAALPVILGAAVVLILIVAGFLSQALKPAPVPTAAPTEAPPAAQATPTEVPTEPVELATEAAPAAEPVVPADLPAKIAFYSFRSGNDNIYLMDANGGSPLPITFWDGFEKSPVWSPDGRQIAYSDFTDLWLVDANTSKTRQLTGDGNEKYPGGFSPDGRYLYYEMSSSTYRLDLETGQSTLLIQGARSPAVSPDGAQIAFWNSSGFFVANSDGSGQRLITADATQAWMKSITWSPDGALLACVSASNDLKLFNLNGVEVTQLTHGEGNSMSPAFSPDGNMLLFTSDRDGNNEIYLLHLQTRQITRLTDNPANDDGAVWQPGRH